MYNHGLTINGTLVFLNTNRPKPLQLPPVENKVENGFDMTHVPAER